MMHKLITLCALAGAIFVNGHAFGQEKVIIKLENTLGKDDATLADNKKESPKEQKKTTGRGRVINQQVQVNIVNIHLGARAPKLEPVWINQPLAIHCQRGVQAVEYVRWTCGRSVVWFVAQPGNKPTTYYPPFLLRTVGNQLIAQEQLWTVEYVQAAGGKQNVIWATQVRVKPDREFKLPVKTACFDVTRGFEGASVKASTPFVLYAPADQAWWGTGVPGVGGRLEADVVAGYPLVLRLPCSGQAMFEGAGGKQLGPVIFEE